jgi:hypothetical protein
MLVAWGSQGGMRYRITVSYAGAVDPLGEHHLAQLVAWWACRAPA